MTDTSDQDDILNEFREAKALLDGHFILSSGYHSRLYLQCARLFVNPERGERLCRKLADKLRSKTDISGVTTVISPAMGGVIVGYELARQLNMNTIFFERVAGRFELRRGFEIKPDEKCMLVEDVVTTGLSSRECIEAASKLGAQIVYAASLVDRSGGTANLPVPLISLLELEIPIFAPDQLPPDLQNSVATKPGSRSLTT